MLVDINLVRIQHNASKLQSRKEALEFLSDFFSTSEILKHPDEILVLNRLEQLAQNWAIPLDTELMIMVLLKNMLQKKKEMYNRRATMHVHDELFDRIENKTPWNTGTINKIEDFITFNDLSEQLAPFEGLAQEVLDMINSIPGTSWKEKTEAWP